MSKKKTGNEDNSVLGKMSLEDFLKQKARKVAKLRHELSDAKENLTQIRQTLKRTEAMTFQGISDGYQMDLDFGVKPEETVAKEKNKEDEEDKPIVNIEDHTAEGGKRQSA